MKSVAPFPFWDEVYKHVEYKHKWFIIHSVFLLKMYCVFVFYFFHMSLPFAYNSNPHTFTLVHENFIKAGPQQIANKKEINRIYILFHH